MTTLSQIRKNKKENSKFITEFHRKYNNPTSLALISKIIKKENIKIINEISEENGLNKYEKQELLTKFIKPNYYTPYVVNSETKENLQQLI
tara:strand:+ start:321 stop:593 length:273 start_codon:yes stop_codon:yes gene_type:complete